MHGAAVEVHLPVDAGLAHLGLEARALVGGDEGVVGADADKDVRLGGLGVGLGGGGLEPAVEARDGLDVGARAGSSRHMVPPKQKPMAPMRAPSTSGRALSAARPALARARMREVSA